MHNTLCFNTKLVSQQCTFVCFPLHYFISELRPPTWKKTCGGRGRFSHLAFNWLVRFPLAFDWLQMTSYGD